MGIDKITPLGFHSPVSNKARLLKAEESGITGSTEEKSDVYRQTELENSPTPAISDIARIITNEKISLDKNKYNYWVQSCAKGPDGTTYIAYQDPQNAEGNYLSAVSPDGVVKWETTPGKSRIESISADLGGIIYVLTNDTFVAYNADGSEKFRHKPQEKISWHFTDKSGLNIFTTTEGKLYIVGSDGKKLENSKTLDSIKAEDIVIDGEGAIWCRDGKEFVNVNILTGKIINKIKFEDKIKDSSTLKRTIRNFLPLPDGGMLFVLQNNEMEPSPYSSSMLFEGHLPLMHARLPFMFPDIGALGYAGGTKTIISNFIYRLDKFGKVVLETKDLGIDPKFVFTDNGKVFISDNKKDEENLTIISTLDNNGKLADFTKVDGFIYGLKYRKSDGHLFIELGTKFIEVNPEGKAIRTVDTTGKLARLRLEGFEDDGSLILYDPGGDSVYRLPASTDVLIKLTDHTKDYYYKVKAPEVYTTEPTGSYSKIQVCSDQVNIGGVKLPRRLRKNL